MSGHISLSFTVHKAWKRAGTYMLDLNTGGEGAKLGRARLQFDKRALHRFVHEHDIPSEKLFRLLQGRWVTLGFAEGSSLERIADSFTHTFHLHYHLTGSVRSWSQGVRFTKFWIRTGDYGKIRLKLTKEAARHALGEALGDDAAMKRLSFHLHTVRRKRFFRKVAGAQEEPVEHEEPHAKAA